MQQPDEARSPLWERMSMELHGAAPGPHEPYEPGGPLTLHTSRGHIRCFLHEPTGKPTPNQGRAVLWAAGAHGGVSGPANGMYPEMAEALAARGIASLRLDYRKPANLDESTLDVLAGVWHLAAIGFQRTALVGHSFGGGVVISASRYSTNVRAVAAFSSQTDGAEEVVLLSGRPLLLLHGEADTVLPMATSQLIYQWAFDPKKMVTYPGAGHGLRECADEVRAELRDWLEQALG
jgi:pimeloyl-ACP methyl ester carboxylesterase